MSTRSVALTRYERDIWRAVLNISLGMNTSILVSLRARRNHQSRDGVRPDRGAWAIGGELVRH